MDYLILFAHPLEAAPTIKALGAQLHDDHYRFDEGKIVVTGLGAINAAIAAAHYPAAEVWNAGLAGALTDLPIGTLCDVHAVSRYLALPAGISVRSQQLATSAQPTISLTGTHTLVSCDHIVHTDELCKQLPYDLVDMEGYGVARACQQLGRRCRLIKIVSDHAGTTASREIMERLPTLAEALATSLCTQLRMGWTSVVDE